MNPVVINSLKLMVMGMSAIFFVIIIIYISVNLMFIFTKKKEKIIETHEIKSETTKCEDENEIVTSTANALASINELYNEDEITAAIYCCLGYSRRTIGYI